MFKGIYKKSKQSIKWNKKNPIIIWINMRQILLFTIENLKRLSKICMQGKCSKYGKDKH